MNQLAQSQGIPPPIGGMNSIDALSSMPLTDAVLLNNLFPTQYGLEVRKGSLEWATMPTSSPVLSLIAFAGIAPKLYACSGSVIYEITSHTPVAVVTGLGSVEYNFINFANSAGLWAVAVNGLDDPVVFDSTSTIRRLTLGNGITPYTINGHDPKDFINVMIHARRLWFVEKNSTSAWYLPPDAIYGDVTEYDFGPTWKRGGTLLILATWTVDSGTGMDDKLVAISNRGEASLYSGTDPGSLADWNFDGVFFIGAPLSDRCAVPFGSELVVLTQKGLIPFSQMIVSTELNPRADVVMSNKINLLLSDLTNRFSQFFGWTVKANMEYNELIVNVPGATQADIGPSPGMFSATILPMASEITNTSVQLVMNLTTGAWAAFTNTDAIPFVQWAGSQAFGRNNVVYRWDFGNQDFVAQNGTGGVPIQFEGIQAFTYAGVMGQLKHVKMAQPWFITNNGLNFGIQIEADFKILPFNATINEVAGISSLWGTALWGVDLWNNSPNSIHKPWINCPIIGFALAVHIKGNSDGIVTWASTNLLTEVGGVV